MKKTVNLFLLSILCILLLSSCTSLIGGLSDSLYMQKDIQLVKDGAPSYLLLVEALIHSNPKNKKMLSLGIQLFSAYSSAFVVNDDRKIIFSNKSKEWAMMLLRTYPKFKKLENAGFDKYKKWVKSIGKKDIPDVFWAANAWIMWIISNSDSMDAMMDLPKAKAIIDRIYDLDSSYYYGAPHLFYGIFYSMMPESIGGDLVKAKEEFDKALEFSGDKFLMTRVSYAQFYCKAKYDRENYKKILTEVADADLDKHPETRLLNSFAKTLAKKSLEEIDDFFYDDDF